LQETIAMAKTMTLTRQVDERRGRGLESFARPNRPPDFHNVTAHPSQTKINPLGVAGAAIAGIGSRHAMKRRLAAPQSREVGAPDSVTVGPGRYCFNNAGKREVRFSLRLRF
jgi:hypothetical protein